MHDIIYLCSLIRVICGHAALSKLCEPIIFSLQICFSIPFSSMGWRFGLQTLTGVLFSTFFLGTFYRSASLYHPQRRAILHLKNQKRKIKDKTKEAKPPFFDLTTLHSRTVQILLASTAISSLGINSPIIYLVKLCMFTPLYSLLFP